MGNMITIFSLMISYAIIFSVTIGINRRMPDLTTYQNPRPENFSMLNHIHFFISVIMMLPVLTGGFPAKFLFFPDRISIGKAIAFLACFGTIAFFPWKKFNSHDKKTEHPTLHPFPVFLYGSFRLLYLISYECFFRGWLLVGFCLLAGVTWGVIINISLYTLIHIQKDKKELLACIPFGLLVCLFTVWWQSAWPAIIFHSQIAIIHEWPSLRKFVSPKRQAAL
jgi:CAAX prenyl protease-like protein